MKYGLFLFLFTPLALAAEDFFLTCQVTEIAAKEAEGKTDGKLKKIGKFIEKDDSLKKYKSFKFAGKKSVSAAKDKSGTVKLKNKEKFTLTAISINRAQRKNTITVDVSVAGRSGDRKSFIDREYLLIPAGTLDKKSDLLLAVTCPVFP